MSPFEILEGAGAYIHSYTCNWYVLREKKKKKKLGKMRPSKIVLQCEIKK